MGVLVLKIKIKTLKKNPLQALVYDMCRKAMLGARVQTRPLFSQVTYEDIKQHYLPTYRFQLSVTNLPPLSANEKLFVSRQFFETYGVINYGSGWRKDVVNQCVESELPTHPLPLPGKQGSLPATSSAAEVPLLLS